MGSLGLPERTNRNTPVKYNNNTDWSSIGTGLFYHTLVINGTETNNIPILVAPADKSVDVHSPVLSWQLTNNTNYYQVQISTSNNFSTIFIDKLLPAGVFKPNGLLPNTKYFWRVRSMNQATTTDWSDIWDFTTSESSTDEQIIILNTGWNMISTYIEPQDTDLEVLLASVLDDVVIVKNNLGEVYIPEFEINQIGNWQIEQGYQIYVTKNLQLKIQGTKVIPENADIDLNAGWNMIAYLRDNPMDIEIALESLTNDDALIIVKNNLGQVYIPMFEINDIGNMLSGQGYQIYLIKNSTLTYPEN